MADSKIPFPYPPYAVQSELMHQLFTLLSAGGNGRVGIFESPTGTGKSLSLISASLHWLINHNAATVAPPTAATATGAATKPDAAASSSAAASAGSVHRATPNHDWVDDQVADEQLNQIETKQKLYARTLNSFVGRKPTDYLKRVAAGSGASNGGGRFPNVNQLAAIKRKAANAPTELEKVLAAAMDSKEDSDLIVDWVDPSDGKAVAQVIREVVRADKLEAAIKRGTMGDAFDADDVDPLEHVNQMPKIYYCSRTHSQLDQFLDELKKTEFAKKVRCVSLGSRKQLCVNSNVSTNKNGELKSTTQINDACLDLGKPKPKPTADEKTAKRTKLSTAAASSSAAASNEGESGGGGCPYLGVDAQRLFRNFALANPYNIEESHRAGKTMSACPYYGSRAAIAHAHLVLLPYQSLLHESTRSSLGIDVKDSVVIIDEAHNLIETINDVHSVVVSAERLTSSLAALTRYVDKYSNRFKGKNLDVLNRIKKVVAAMIQFLRYEPPPAAAAAATATATASAPVPAAAAKLPVASSSASASRVSPNSGTRALAGGRTSSLTSPQPEKEQFMLTPNEFCRKLGIDNVETLPLARYIEQSELAKKLNGFMERYPDDVPTVKIHGRSNSGAGTAGEYRPKNLSALLPIKELLQSLSLSDKDGRILVERYVDAKSTGAQFHPHPQSQIRFLMLNPMAHFEKIVSEARAVILAGGTMQPFNLFVDQLFLSTPTTHLTTFQCGHVVSPNNVLACTLDAFNGQAFTFDYSNRNNQKMVLALGSLIRNVCSTVPDGVVVFFSSYNYMKEVVRAWKASGVWNDIDKKKKIIVDEQSDTGAWREYEALIERGKPQRTGALLLCVVGGRLSEGINFSNELARCVMVVGLPYPNKHDPVLKEKMSYLNARRQNAIKQRSAAAGAASAVIVPETDGDRYYQNLCMRAVNQSIGRSIRSINDYASILLVDTRYKSESVTRALPKWIHSRVVHCPDWVQAMKEIRPFFEKKKSIPTAAAASGASIPAVTPKPTFK